MKIFTQTVLAIGRVTPQHVALLGTGFLVADDGRVATTRHVVGNDDAGLCVLFPRITDINAYQDTTDASCKPVPARTCASQAAFLHLAASIRLMSGTTLPFSASRMPPKGVGF